MRKMKMWMAAAGIAAVMLSGCGGNAEAVTIAGNTEMAETSAEAEESVPMETLAPAETAAKTEESAATEILFPEETESGAEQWMDNFSVPADAAAEFAGQVKAVFAEKDLEGLAELCSYPLYLGFAEEGETVENKEELIGLGEERIFTEELVSAVAGADTAGLSASKAGFVISAGEKPNVVFGVVDGRLAVRTINY